MYALKNFAKFTGKYLCQNSQGKTSQKTDSDKGDFLGIFAKFLKTPFSTEHLRWLFLKRYKENYVQVVIHYIVSQYYKDTHSQ